MRAERIFHAIPEASQEFVALMQRVPDPPGDLAEEEVENHLRALYQLYDEKRRAAEQLDGFAWKQMLQKEVTLIKQADVI